MKNDILLKIIKAAIIASLFTPLVIHSGFIFPFVFPKTAAFQILVEIMFFLWLILIMTKPEYRPTRTRIFWALVIFLSILFLASVFGADFAHSFWSNYERMTGFITLLHYFAYWLVLTSVLKTKKDWLLVFDFFIVVSLLLCFFALGQQLGLKGFLLSGGRISATFGNAAYFAAYLLFILFMITFMFFQRQAKRAKVYYLGAFLFNFLILYWTQTRGALLAFAASFILFLLALVFWPRLRFVSSKEAPEKEAMVKFRARLKKIALIILISFAIIISLIYFFKNTALVKNSATLRRLTSISLAESTTQTRLLAWRMSWKGFLDRPILGWGWENYNLVFNKYYDPKLYPTENWFDRAHNIVFDVLVTSGLTGFLSFLGIFGAAFWVLWQAFRQKRIDFLNFALFAILFVAYLLQNLFVFDMLHSYLPLFTLLAFINWIEKSQKANLNQLAPKVIQPSIFFKLILIFIFILGVYFINIKPALASFYGIQALAHQNKGPQEVMKYFKKSLNYGTFGRFEVRLQIFETARDFFIQYEKIQDKKSVEELAVFALEEGEKTLKEKPLDTRHLLMIGQLNLICSKFDQTKLNRGVEILEMAYQQSPTKQIILYALGEAKLKQGKTEEGLDLFKKAVQINDRVPESHWNLTLVYFSLGDIENGQRKIAEIEQRFGKLNGSQYKKITDIFAMQEKYQEAIAYLLKAIETEPTNADYYATLAGYYNQVGDKAKAKEAALKAAELDTSLKQAAEEFIKSLEK